MYYVVQFKMVFTPQAVFLVTDIKINVHMMFQLHKHNYDTSKALQALVKCPALKTIEKKWSDEDSVSCMKL